LELELAARINFSGDSGGGLVFLDNTNKWAIYGIVSAGVAKRGGGCDPR